jgi:uncharacterized membrane protein YidH (DUF202 family)
VLVTKGTGRGILTAMRKVLAAVFFIVTGACLLLAAVTFSQVFDDYKDSEDAFYLEMAAYPFVIGLLCLVAGVWAIRGSLRR